MSLVKRNAPGSNNRSASTNNRQERTYEVKYIVESYDGQATGPGEVRNFVLTELSGIGHYYFYENGDHYEWDTNSYLQSVDVQDISDDGLTWEATANYSAEIPDDDNPFAEPVQVEFDCVTYEVVADRDIRGRAIRNSAGDPFNDPIPREESRPILRITRNEPSFPVLGALAMKDTINNANWNTFPSGTVKAAAPKTRTAYSPTSGYYFQTSYEFYVNPSGWNYSIMDVGFNQLVSGVRQKIYVDGQPTNDPLPLQSGRALEPSSDPVYLSFEVYQPRDFSYFNLDNIIT